MSTAPARRPLITGEGRRETAEWMAIHAPGDHELLGEVASAGIEDVDRAVRAAASAQREWAQHSQ